MKRTFVAVLLCCSAFSLVLLEESSRSAPRGPNDAPAFELEAVDGSCAEAWLKITLGASLQPRAMTLTRAATGQLTGKVTILTTMLQATDTLVKDEVVVLFPYLKGG